MKVKLLSHVRLLATSWTAAYQAPLFMGFSRQVDLERGYPLRPFICLGFEDLLDKVSKVGRLPLF